MMKILLPIIGLFFAILETGCSASPSKENFSAVPDGQTVYAEIRLPEPIDEILAKDGSMVTTSKSFIFSRMTGGKTTMLTVPTESHITEDRQAILETLPTNLVENLQSSGWILSNLGGALWKEGIRAENMCYLKVKRNDAYVSCSRMNANGRRAEGSTSIAPRLSNAIALINTKEKELGQM